ncbi:MAG: hypothetical protein ACI85I_002140 [Arenicella sp.]|jgi:hypothetical protein
MAKKIILVILVWLSSYEISFSQEDPAFKIFRLEESLFNSLDSIVLGEEKIQKIVYWRNMAFPWVFTLNTYLYTARSESLLSLPDSLSFKPNFEFELADSDSIPSLMTLLDDAKVNLKPNSMILVVRVSDDSWRMLFSGLTDYLNVHLYYISTNLGNCTVSKSININVYD